MGPRAAGTSGESIRPFVSSLHSCVRGGPRGGCTSARIGNNKLLASTAVVASIIIALSFIWTPDSLPGISICAFHSLTGRPCAGCGLTRAFCAISHGQFRQAWDFNPFGFFFYAVSWAALLQPIVSRLMPKLACRLYCLSTLQVVGIAIGVGMMVFGVARAMTQGGL